MCQVCRTHKGHEVPDKAFLDLQGSCGARRRQVERQMAFREVKKERTHRKKELGESKRRDCFQAVFASFLVLRTSFHLQKLLRTPKTFCLHGLYLSIFIVLKIKTQICLKVIYFKNNKPININKIKHIL